MASDMSLHGGGAFTHFVEVSFRYCVMKFIDRVLYTRQGRWKQCPYHRRHDSRVTRVPRPVNRILKGYMHKGVAPFE